MAQIHLADDEVEMLREILASYLSDLRMEVADTDQKDFRDGLKEVEVFLKDLISRLTQSVK